MKSAAFCASLALAAGSHHYKAFNLDSQNFKFSVYTVSEDFSGELPVIFFVSGLSGVAPVMTYSDLLGRIADENYLVVGLDHLKFPNYPVQGQDFHDLLEWAGQGGLAAEFASRGFKSVPDVANRAAVMGQSAGNHVVGQALVDGCSIAKALVMIDPVDGLDPFGKVHSEDLITPGQKLSFNIPALHLDNYLDPEGDALGVSCSPAQLSGPRWFDAMQGPVWNVNATKYGHVDCLNSGVGLIGGVMCPTKPLTNKKNYRKMLASSITTFLGAMFDGRTDDLALLEDASQFGVEVVVRQDLKGIAHSDVKAGCTNTNTGIIV
jgi:hypothetical protein